MHEIGKLALVTPTTQSILDSLLIEFETQSELYRKKLSPFFPIDQINDQALKASSCKSPNHISNTASGAKTAPNYS